MKTLSQRIIDFAHSGESTTATDKDRQLADAAPHLLQALQMAMQIGDGCSRGFLGKFLKEAGEAIALATGSEVSK